MRDQIRFGEKVTVKWVCAERTGVFINNAVFQGIWLAVWTLEVMA